MSGHTAGGPGMTVGKLVDEAKALGTATYVDTFGKVWRVRYIGEIDMAEWLSQRPVIGGTDD